MRWRALTTKAKATIVIAVAAVIWIGGVGSAGALVGAAVSGDGQVRSASFVSSPAPAQPAAPRETRTATPTPTPTPTPDVVVSEVTEDTSIPFERKTVDDPNLPKGQSHVSTPGVAGVLSTTYRVTTTDGVETARTPLEKRVTRAAVAEITVVGSFVAPAAPAPAPQAPAPVPEQQAPAAGLITPGAFCADAQNGAVAQAGNGRSYQCGGKGPDANGHLHWNTM